MKKKNKTLISALLAAVMAASALFLTGCSSFTFVYEATTGGSVTGELSQSLRPGKDGSTVTAQADDGYFFVRWSDGYKYPQRQDAYPEENTGLNHREKTPKSKTLTAVFAPKTKVYKVLMVYITDIQATIHNKNTNEPVEVNYQMTDTELKICELISVQMGAYMNDMMDGQIYFEIDSVFTTEPVGEDSILQGSTGLPDGSMIYDYDVYPPRVPELSKGQGGESGMDESNMDTFKGYEIVICTNHFNDYDYVLHHAAGHGGNKYCSVHMESNLKQFIIAGIEFEALFDLTFSGYSGFASWDNIISTYIHELTHSVEAYYWYHAVPGYMDYHSVLNAYGYINDLKITKLYLQGKAEMNGETGGIPPSFWDRF